MAKPTEFGMEVGKDLQYKEWRYFCEKCRWMAEKNSVMHPFCSACGHPLDYVWQDEKNG